MSTDDSIRVKVTRHAGRRFLIAYYDDPITGKREQRSTKATTQREAERFAAKWEAELRKGEYNRRTKTEWAEFRRRYEDEKLAEDSPHTRTAGGSALNHLERVVDPQRVGVLTTAVIDGFRSDLIAGGMKRTTVAAHLGHLRTCLNWAYRNGYLPAPVKVELPKTGKGKGKGSKRKLMRSRAITTEEFERMLKATEKKRPRDTDTWKHYLTGLWLSGLRLEESLALSWDGSEPFCIDLAGRFPRLRIYGESQKNGDDQFLPLTPDFARFLLTVPEADRVGSVFGIHLTPKRVCRVVSAIGRAAGVVTNPKIGKTATAHDFRRAFGTRWSIRVKPAVLQQLMRHATIETTLRYYVDQDADEVSAMLWQAETDRVGTFVGSSDSEPAETPAENEVPMQ